MGRRAWFWAAMCLDVVLLAFGVYMAESAAQIAIRTDGAFAPLAISILFAALPVFCLTAPYAAFRADQQKRSSRQIVAVFAAPWVYALFLVIFLFNS
jgi:hypothetical protein